MVGHKVGGEVDAYCTKCRMMLAHTVLAMVGDKIARVRCNTCMGEHAFKANPPGTKTAKAAGTKTRAASTRATKEKAELRPFEEIFAGRDPSTEGRAYSPKERFEAGEILLHPTFGMGLVQTARHDKVDVVFKAGPKTLVHGLAGGAKSAPVTFDKSRRDSSAGGAADKPPPGQPTGLHAVQSVPLTEIPATEVEAADADGAAESEAVHAED